MTTAAANTLENVEVEVEKQRTIIPLHKIIDKLKKTGSVIDTAKIFNVSYQAIYQRLKKNKIDYEKFIDYTDDKALSHEILQYRIASGLSAADIKKMQGGSKVLAICQLDDKIQAHRGRSDTGNSVSIVLNLACQSHEKVIDVTPKK